MGYISSQKKGMAKMFGIVIANPLLKSYLKEVIKD